MGRDFKVIEADNIPAPLRADIFLSRKLNESRRTVQKMLENGAFVKNGKSLKKGDLIVKGDKIEFTGSIKQKSLIPAYDLNIPLIYEDENLIVLDKPSGIPVQPLTPSETGTAANWIIAHYPELEGVGFSLLEPGILHRLDIDTSGVLLIARNNEIFQEIRKEFSDRKIKKSYLAVVEGIFNREGWCREPLYHKTKSKMWVFGEGIKAKRVFEAESHFKLIEVKNNRSLIEVEITTGVMHQIRVHLAYLGFPVLGDALYGLRREDETKRALLHCFKIGFYHPVQKKFVEFKAEPPRQFKSCFSLGKCAATV